VFWTERQGENTGSGCLEASRAAEHERLSDEEGGRVPSAASGMVQAAQARRAGGRKPGAPRKIAPMHGMLSATVIILAYVAVAIAAGYTAIKVIRGGPHDG
jgi:hypothetical protein